MADRVFFIDSADPDPETNVFLPLTGGSDVYLTPIGELDSSWSRQEHVCFIGFLDVNGDPATAAAGTIEFLGYPSGGQKLPPSSGDASIDATKVIDPANGASTYAVPYFVGPVERMEVRITGVTPSATPGEAQFAYAFWWRR